MGFQFFNYIFCYIWGVMKNYNNWYFFFIYYFQQKLNLYIWILA